MSEQPVHLQRTTRDEGQGAFVALLRESLVEVQLQMLHEVADILGDRSIGVADQRHLQAERTLDQARAVVILVEVIDCQMMRGTLVVASSALVRQLQLQMVLLHVSRQHLRCSEALL